MTSFASHIQNLPFNPFKCSEENIIQVLSRDIHLDIEDYYQAWAEHDGLHFLTDTPLSKQGERIIASYEKHFNCGWYAKGEHYNGFYAPFEFYEIPEDLTMDKILKTAEHLRNLFGVAQDYF